MKCRAEFAELPSEARVEIRNDICDLWVRKNIEQITTDEGKHYEADEAYMQMPKNDAPSVDDVIDNIDEWFDVARQWTAPAEPTVHKLASDVDYIKAILGIV